MPYRLVRTGLPRTQQVVHPVSVSLFVAGVATLVHCPSVKIAVAGSQLLSCSRQIPAGLIVQLRKVHPRVERSIFCSIALQG